MNSPDTAGWRVDCHPCPHERVHRIEYEQLTRNLDELKARVGRVEANIARGVLLLVANLAGVIVTLLQAYIET